MQREVTMNFRASLRWRRVSAHRALSRSPWPCSWCFALLPARRWQGPSARLSRHPDLCVRHTYGLSELLVRMTPLFLTSVALALPSRLGLINVGGEGQLYRALGWPTAGALAFPDLSVWLLLPLITVLGFVGGALWGPATGIAARRQAGQRNDLDAVAQLCRPVDRQLLHFLVRGGARRVSSYPQSPAFVDAARLPSLGSTRVHLGLLYGLVCLALYGPAHEPHPLGIGDAGDRRQPEASVRLGIPVAGYMIAAMAVAGGARGLAGMGEVSAIQGRLVANISPGYGYMGFLIAWLAGGSAIGNSRHGVSVRGGQSVGDILQITQGVPYAVVNLLMAVILLIVLGQRGEHDDERVLCRPLSW